MDENVGGTPAAPVDGAPISYEQFGVNWIRRVLNLERVLRTVEDVLGESIELGPIGAGPGRAFASVSIVGKYRPTSGHEVLGADLLTYAIDLPISVVFDLELPIDKLTFNAEVVVPLVLVVHTESAVRLRMEIQRPTEDQIRLQLQTPTRRGTMLQKVANLDSELRRFLLRVLDIELSKPYVVRAMNLDMEELIDASWPALSAQFLPRGPEDRRA